MFKVSSCMHVCPIHAVTAGKYRYKVYPYGTADNSSINPSAFVDITPWTTATHTFTTPAALSAGLYSVWVEVQHKDDATLFKTTDTDATSYAIGAGSARAVHLQYVACMQWLLVQYIIGTVANTLPALRWL